jgi:ATP-dependent DNA helicase RecG
MAKNLAQVIKSGETETVEFKSSLAEREQILETVSAFANVNGGTVYVGIDASGKVAGVQLGKKTLEDLANEIKSKTDPKIFPSIDILTHDGKQLARIVVPEHPTKPVWVGDKVFERVGRTNQRVPAERTRQLMRESQPFQWDQHAIAKAKISEIDSRKLRVFLRAVEQERNTIFEGSKSVAQALTRLHLLRDGKLTAAAALLFGKNPQARFVQARVRCARFRGTDPVDFGDMQLIEGTILEQVPEALKLIRKHIEVSAKITGRAEREEIWEYPQEAIREAVVNAICHRDYEDSGNVQIRILDDRLEIWNPGTLPPGLTVESLRGTHPSRPRNSLIAECFYLIKYIEQWGTGTNRIIRLCKEAGLPPPEFAQKAGSFVVTLKKGRKRRELVEVLPLNRTQLQILKYVKKHKTASTKQLAKYLGVSDRAVQKNLQGMMHLVKWTGKSPNDPTGKYVLISDSE